MRAAKLQIERLSFPEEDASAEVHLDPRAALKMQVAERLAAHRSRRGRSSGANLVAIAEPKPKPARANRIASAVAERYAQTQSYRDFLAAEAARAIEEAHAAAEIAARNAEAVAVAQQQLLAELANWEEPESRDDQPSFPPAAAESHNPIAAAETQSGVKTPQTPAVAQAEAPASGRMIHHPIAGLTVRLYEDVGIRHPQNAAATRAHQAAPDEEENFLLDDEIAFRQTPVFPEPAGPTMPIHANLIEFPRQLVAPRKARPRLAEGPLREEAAAAPATAQLRIFEVEPEQISTVPGVGVEPVVPEWSPIHLDAIERDAIGPDASPAPAQQAQPQLHTLPPLQTAPLNLRAMALAVDSCILGLAFLAAVAVFGSSVSVLPAWPIAAGAAVVTLLVLFILYHMLFFTFAEATPGMRYARIGLCTFSDENPTRIQMRRRTWAILLSACPLGIGFLWALVDDEGLGWHDRISRMYQRGY